MLQFAFPLVYNIMAINFVLAVLIQGFDAVRADHKRGAPKVPKFPVQACCVWYNKPIAQYSVTNSLLVFEYCGNAPEHQEGFCVWGARSTRETADSCVQGQQLTFYQQVLSAPRLMRKLSRSHGGSLPGIHRTIKAAVISMVRGPLRQSEAPSQCSWDEVPAQSAVSRFVPAKLREAADVARALLRLRARRAVLLLAPERSRAARPMQGAHVAALRRSVGRRSAKGCIETCEDLLAQWQHRGRTDSLLRVLERALVIADSFSDCVDLDYEDERQAVWTILVAEDASSRVAGRLVRLSALALGRRSGSADREVWQRSAASDCTN